MSLFVDIEKNYGSFCLRTKVEAGDETLALLGASGCGKSLTLKCIAGIERPDRGKIIVDGVTLFDSEKRIDLSPQRRRTGLMFQNYALFPQMTVLQNIQTGARREKNRLSRQGEIERVMEGFGLKEYARHYPHQLSGGQQQRVALARILVSQPRILLLDEPFSALDSHLRFRLEQEVRQVIRDFGKTVVLVSHDRDEVFRMAQRIAVMENGTVQVTGTRQEVFAAPGTCKGALLTGCKNISPIRPEADGTVWATDWGIPLHMPNRTPETEAVGIRAHDILPGEGTNSFLCHVTEEIENPFSFTLLLRPDGAGEGASLAWETDKTYWQEHRHSSVRICLPPEHLLPLRNGTGGSENEKNSH